MGSRDLRELGLVLGLGLPSAEQRKSSEPAAAGKPHDLGEISECPLLTLSLFGENVYKTNQTVTAEVYREESAVSSFSNASVKREREMRSEEVEAERVSSRISDEDEDGSNGRKKLRLTKNQSTLLEESFKHHSTLNPKQKQDLAMELNLRPRQVEVWFQNRRARTKLKQTELDCEFLKKWCETLTEENRWLQKELQELKAMKFSHPLYKQIPSATLTMCPACERIGSGGEKAQKRIFTNPSPAC